MSVRGVLFKRPPYRPRGIAFVVMATPAEAALAVEQLNNTPVGGRELMVQMAEPLPPTFGRNYTSRSVGAIASLLCLSRLAWPLLNPASGHPTRSCRHCSRGARRAARQQLGAVALGVAQR